ncbi:hypothetical protein DYBT9623_02186 [Dyadobacter sp. CECT 9623]|uniref:Disease resistance R13L4/SHOC-2-like LRR domain-containing protein n=1 Tax=Dyadobacter linearis TaxID=2823330 RepID=A0ABM8UPL3_9BACT|nr:leucine-rich repeat domain-containing protein [Dyadobacter sp. CECT 9623]CAG5069450.1 hypothetical protein DYBT9623_02186 [Dyadobacter sp. CECT 9623]
MKTFLLCLLLACGQILIAQPVIINQYDPAFKSLPADLGTRYKANTEQTVETPYSIQKRFHDVCLRLFGNEAQPELNVRASAYVNEQGKVDYFIFSFSNQFYRVQPEQKGPIKVEGNDSLSVIFKEGIQPFLADLVSKRTLGQKAILGLFAYINPSQKSTREVSAPRDSVVKSVAAAIEVRDTLKVKELSLNRALLTSMPDVIYRFPNLERLFLADNDIENVNINLARLPKLQQIDLSGNILKTDAIELTKNKTLISLNLLKNQIDDIPPAVKKCKKLQTLWLGSNQITNLTNTSFRRAKPVRDLNLYKAELTSLPKGVKKLRKLEVLDLYYNKIETLPKTICKLRRLTHLAVSHNDLGALPEKIYKLKKVHTLYAHHNHLSKLPPRMVEMQNLQILDLGYNWLTNFPEQLTAFTKLQELDLSGNNFPDFPQQLLQIKKLDKLYLRGNPFLGENREIKYEQQFSLLKSRNIEVFY